MKDLGGDPAKINPLAPAELVIDHSVIADHFGTPEAAEPQRRARVRAQPRALPVPALGPDARSTSSRSCRRAPASCTRSTSSHLARVVMVRDGQAYPDTCVGTDSHTTMVNGLGVLGWGVGGIEAEAAMLGQPVSMLIPRVVGFKLTGALPEGATATDLVLTITEMLRKHGVVGKFVEFYGDGVSRGAAGQPRHHRQHEPGVRLDRARSSRSTTRRCATCASPAAPTSRSRSSRPTPRSRASGTTPTHEPVYSEYLELDLGDGRAVARRPEAPAGPRDPRRGASEAFARGAADVHRRSPRTTATLHDRRRAGHDRPRRRRDRRDHLVHQHLEPVGDDRRGAARQEGRREGPDPQAVGQDHARARVEGRHRLLRQGRPHALPREARLRPRRLRLHHLHRQLRPAARGGLRGGQRRRPRGRRRCSRATATSRAASTPTSR